MLSSLNAVISTNESTQFITVHVIYNPAYTYKFQLKTTCMKLAFQITFTQSDFLWNSNVQIAAVWGTKWFIQAQVVLNVLLEWSISVMVHTSCKERFSENFDYKAVAYLIFFIGKFWFQKCNFWKKSLSPFWGCRGQTTWKPKTTKILNENS